MSIHHFHNLKVSKIEPETEEAVSIVFAVPEHLRNLYRYTQGQHLVMKAEIDGEEVRRNYSICSSVNDSELRIAVKKVASGRFSTFANETLRVNDELAVMPPEGSFFTPLAAENRKNYLAFAAGSGITPILSILKSVLESESGSTFTLVYGNKTVASIMFRETLLGLKNRYPQRFELINILSREQQETELLNGRITAEKVEKLLEHVVHFEAVDEVFICGPQAMTEAVRETLTKHDFDPRHIHFELFGAAPVRCDTEAVSDHRAPLHKVSVIIDGKQTRVELAESGKSILDAALAAGADLPFACKGGVCSTCKARVRAGRVRMDVNYALEEDEVAAGFILTCQSHPLTDHVVVDFDAL